MDPRRLFNEINTLKRRTKHLDGGAFTSNITLAAQLTASQGGYFASRVGIGTTSPDYELDVAGDIGINEYLYHNGDADTYIRFQNNNVNIVAGGKSAIKLDTSTGKIQINNTNENLDFQIMADDGNVILHTDAGTNKVGIGVTDPQELLHLKSSTSAEPVLLIENTNADAQAGILKFYKSSTTSPAAGDEVGLFRFFGKDAAGDDANIAFIVAKAQTVTDSAYEGGLHFGVASAGANAVSTLSLIGEGTAKTTYAIFGDPWEGNTTTKVGIGTADPEAYLDIRNTVDDGTTNRTMLRLHNYRSDDADVNDFGPISIDFVIENLGGGTKEGVARIAAVSSPAGTDHSTILGEKTSGLIFSTMNDDTLAEAMRINHSGYLGIGTTSPATKLHVKGATGTSASVIKLEQLDTDEPFIRFEGTTASDQTKSLSTDTSVGSLTGHVRVSINGTDFWVPYYATN